jgi:hypothetical protein
MRRLVFALFIATLAAATLSAQQNAAPQTARQALLEMFFSKTPGLSPNICLRLRRLPWRSREPWRSCSSIR